MISLSIRRTLPDPSSELHRVIGISIPDWNRIPDARLLHSVDYYFDAPFNHYLLADLIDEVDLWREYEVSQEDPEDRVGTIGKIREALTLALEEERYAVFLGL